MSAVQHGRDEDGRPVVVPMPEQAPAPRPSALAIVGALLARLLGAQQGVLLDVAGLGGLVVGGFTWNTALGCALLGLALLVLNARLQGPSGGSAA